MEFIGTLQEHHFLVGSYYKPLYSLLYGVYRDPTKSGFWWVKVDAYNGCSMGGRRLYREAMSLSVH